MLNFHIDRFSNRCWDPRKILGLDDNAQFLQLNYYQQFLPVQLVKVLQYRLNIFFQYFIHIHLTNSRCNRAANVARSFVCVGQSLHIFTRQKTLSISNINFTRNISTETKWYNSFTKLKISEIAFDKTRLCFKIVCNYFPFWLFSHLVVALVFSY